MIKAIIGLGNPGPRFTLTRHNIGFLVVDELAQRYGGQWRHIEKGEASQISIGEKNIWLIKPLTFMNASGEVLPWLQKKGITAEEMLVVHDELELPFGKTAFKDGGSARGHNGMRSIIAHGGEKSKRLRVGVDRPENREDVSDYVLGKFKQPKNELDTFVAQCADLIEKKSLTKMIKETRS